MRFYILLVTLLCIQLSFAQEHNNLHQPASSEENLDKKFLNLFPYISIYDWTPGMRFTPSIPTSKYLKEIDLEEYNSNNIFPEKLNQDKFQNKIFEFIRYERRNVNCTKGICEKIFFIFECDKVLYEFGTFNVSNNDLTNTITVKNLLYFDEMNSVKDLLVGKELYILKNKWRNHTNRYTFNNPKYVKVIIDSVGLGNQNGPSKIYFSHNEIWGFENISLSGINKDSDVSASTFSEYFSFKNPKDQYPDISEIIWKEIQNNNVVIGMNMDECELSWGKPKYKNSSTTVHGTITIWTYGLSSALYFKEGILYQIDK